MAIPRNLANIAPHVAGSSGGITGLTFNATQSASAGANTLDDYEEGTFTPNDASGAGLTFSTAIGRYVKIGSEVFVHIEVQYPSTANASDAKIGGMPFTVGATGNSNYSGCFVCATNASRTDNFNFSRSTTDMLLRTNANATVANSAYSTKFIVLTGNYSII